MAIEKASLGAAIKHVRTVRGMTQVELARTAGLSDGGKSLALIEQGRRSVSLETLNAIADALDIPPACLTVLGSTKIGKNKAATALMESLQKLISAVLLAQEEYAGNTPEIKGKPARAPRNVHRRKLISTG